MLVRMNEQLTKNEIVPLLKIGDRGWDIKLFEEETKMSTCICANCNGICCDAVELGCDHEDDDIFLYCNGCLNDLITTNDNKCPINKHNNPNIISNRSIRKQISKAIVTCPYSITYKTKGVQMDGNANVVDTMGGYDAKDANQGQNLAVYQQQVYGNEQPLKQNNFCSWRGTLTELINEHLVECTKSNNPAFKLNKRIKELENQCTVQQLKIEKLTTEVALLKQKEKELEVARKREKELLEQLGTQETVFRIQTQELGQMVKEMKQREQVREKQQVEAYHKLLKERETRIAKDKERKRHANGN
eukprot:488983_1